MTLRSPGLFDVDERLQALSAKGDALERIQAVVDFELFRPTLERAAPRSDGAKGGRPAFDHVLMLKALILQAMHGLSDERAEYLIEDRLSFMRLLGMRLLGMRLLGMRFLGLSLSAIRSRTPTRSGPIARR